MQATDETSSGDARPRRPRTRAEHVVLELAEHEVVLRHEILATELSKDDIDELRDRRFLISEGNGAYRLAGSSRTELTAERAALAACTGLCLGLQTAMARAGVRVRWLPHDPAHVHLLVDWTSGVTPTAWYTPHPTRRLDIETETAMVQGVRIATVPRSIRDFAATLPRTERGERELDAWVEEARGQNLLEVWRIAEAAERERSRKVRKRLLDLHDRHVGTDPAAFKSMGERWLRDLIQRLGLPEPLWNVKPPFGTKEVDAYYPHIPLIIEFDGYWVHHPTGKFHRDRRGDRRALIDGLVPTVRITKWDFDHDLPQLERDIVTLLTGKPLRVA